MTGSAHFQVTALAGYATVSVHQRLPGDRCLTLVSLLLDPEAIAHLVGELQAALDQPSARRPLKPSELEPRVVVRKDPVGLWCFTCHHHDTYPVRAAFHTAGPAIDAAHRHATRHSQDVTA